MAWRVARSLLVLRDQLDRRYPDRSKLSDGTIGDAAHATRDSDHNPWYGPGIVSAMDITHDPAHGVDIDRITDELAASRDPRIKYVIANRLIMSGAAGPSPWLWKPYTGPNPHTKHFHLSVVAAPLCDDTRPWDLPSFRTQEDDMPTAQEIANAILDTRIDRGGTEQTGDTCLRDIVAFSDHAWELGREASAAAATPDQVREIVRQELGTAQGSPIA